MGHGKSHLSRVRRASPTPSGNDPGGEAQHHLSRLCATNVGDLTDIELPADQEGVGAAQGLHRRDRHRPLGAAVMVNPDADGRGWAMR